MYMYMYVIPKVKAVSSFINYPGHRHDREPTDTEVNNTIILQPIRLAK